ncbi:hypothetical protein ACU8KH_01077 [Lachancea thermotolerans]
MHVLSIFLIAQWLACICSVCLHKYMKPASKLGFQERPIKHYKGRKRSALFPKESGQGLRTVGQPPNWSFLHVSILASSFSKSSVGHTVVRRDLSNSPLFT